MDNTRAIGYIDEKEDLMELEADKALKQSMAQNFQDYCQLMKSLLAMARVDIKSKNLNKSIYYIEREDEY